MEPFTQYRKNILGQYLSEVKTSIQNIIIAVDVFENYIGESDLDGVPDLNELKDSVNYMTQKIQEVEHKLNYMPVQKEGNENVG